MTKIQILLVCVSFGLVFSEIPKLLLNDGHKIPIVGLGAMGITEEAVRLAIEDGYRHIDTSLNYGSSELLIAKVLKEAFKAKTVKREDLFIVSKLETNYHQRNKVAEGIKTSLSRFDI